MKYFFAPLIMISVCFAPAYAEQEDFPTLARVEYVIACMNARGRENYDNMYACVCAIDYIRTRFTHDEYNEAEAYRHLKGTPGERGSVFRDPEQADQLREKLEQVNAEADKRCFLKAEAGDD